MPKIRPEVPLDTDKDFPDTTHSKYRRKKRFRDQNQMNDDFMDDNFNDDNLSDYSDYIGMKSQTGGEDDIYIDFEKDSYSSH